jgi:hypothetical protein
MYYLPELAFQFEFILSGRKPCNTHHFTQTIDSSVYPPILYVIHILIHPFTIISRLYDVPKNRSL